MKCQHCDSTNVKTNRARTVFCNDCNICVSKLGRPERMVKHPNYGKYGWRFQKHHDDYNQLRQASNRDHMRIVVDNSREAGVL